jgi:hypothetical protein
MMATQWYLGFWLSDETNGKRFEAVSATVKPEDRPTHPAVARESYTIQPTGKTPPAPTLLPRPAILVP